MRGCGLTELAMAVYVLCGIAGAVVVEQAYAMKYGTWGTTNVFWALVAGAFSISNLVLALRVWVSGTMEREVDELTEAVTNSAKGAELLQMDERRIKGTCEALRRSVRAINDNNRRYKLTNLFKLALMADVDLDGTVSIKEFEDMEKFMETQFHIRASDIQATKDLIIHNGYVGFVDVKRIFSKWCKTDKGNSPSKTTGEDAKYRLFFHDEDEHGTLLKERRGWPERKDGQKGEPIEELERDDVLKDDEGRKKLKDTPKNKEIKETVNKQDRIKFQITDTHVNTNHDDVFVKADLGAEVQNLDSAIVVLLRIICLVSCVSALAWRLS
mmetsp:Transcript_15362/g.40601  ORF Transcript_15362/g.40601 Transcript_15362/m.40601 type:complete len:327 (-) Transcript_15362:870-1850(-)